MKWYFVPNGKGQKNWWLLLKHDNDAKATWVGYYPEKIFNGGQLSKNADELEYGGETDPAGDTWPAMGSGAFPVAGWTKAAYQSNIKYTDLDRNVKAVTLTINRQSAFCYLMVTNTRLLPLGERTSFSEGRGEKTARSRQTLCWKTSLPLKDRYPGTPLYRSGRSGALSVLGWLEKSCR